MNNSGLKKIVPAIDMLLLLVVTLFSITGLRRSGPLPELTKAQLEELLKRNKQLLSELEASETEAITLEDKLHTMRELNRDGKSLEMLELLVDSAEERQQEVGETKTALEDMNDDVAYVRKVFQKRYQLHETQASLEGEIKALESKIKQLEDEKKELERKVSEADLHRAEAENMKDKIEKLLVEIGQIKEQIKKLKEQVQASSNERLWLRGDCKTPYILVECDEEGAVVYPGHKRIGINAPKQEFDWLEQEIIKLGAAVLVARPSGFANSYSKFYQIFTELSEKEKNKGNKVILSLWPIGNDESISKYIWKGE